MLLRTSATTEYGLARRGHLRGTPPARRKIHPAIPAIFSARDILTVRDHAGTRILKLASAQNEAFRARTSRSHFQPFFANVRGRGKICGRAFVDDLPVPHDVEPMGDPQHDCQLLLD